MRTNCIFLHSSYIFTSVGGEIQSLAWDPTGERLAVLLKGLSHFFFTRMNPISIAIFLFQLLIIPLSYLLSQVIRTPLTGPQSSPCLRREPDPFLSFCHGLYSNFCRTLAECVSTVSTWSRVSLPFQWVRSRGGRCRTKTDAIPSKLPARSSAHRGWFYFQCNVLAFAMLRNQMGNNCILRRTALILYHLR